ncbi:MAG: hypothetical protein ACOCT8_01265, partial [Actinomycetota bacterium]
TREIEALTRVEEEESHDNTSEALRDVISTGLTEKGYLNGEKTDTRLRVAARRFADAFALLGVLMLGSMFWLPLEYRVFVAVPFAASLACVGLDRALAGIEPAVSHRLARLVPVRRD